MLRHILRRLLLAIPTLFVIDKKGVIRELYVGYDASRHAEIEKLLVTLLAEPAPPESR